MFKLSLISGQKSRRFFSVIVAVALSMGSVVASAAPAHAVTTSIRVLVQDSQTNPIANTPVVNCNTSISPQVCQTALTDAQGLADISAHLTSQGYAELGLGGSQTGFSSINSSIQVVNGEPVYTNGSPQVFTLIPTVWASVSVTVKDSASQLPIRGQSVWFSATGSSAYANTNSSGVAAVSFDTLNSTISSVTASISLGNYNAADVNVPITSNSGSAELLATRTSFGVSGSVSFNGTPVVSKTYSYTTWDGNTSSCHDFEVDSSGRYSIVGANSTQLNLQTSACNSPSTSEYDYLSFQYEAIEGISQVHDIVLTKTGVDLTVLEAGTNNPIANQSVVLVPDSNSGYPRSAVTDQAGVAHFVGLNAGEIYRAAYTRYQGDNSLQLYEVSQNTTSVTVGASNTMARDTLVLTRMSSAPATPVTVTGRIVTGVNNVAVPGATVNASWNSQSGANSQYFQRTVLTDSNGDYSLTNFPHGNISISISANGYRQASTYFVTTVAGGSTYNRGTLNLRPTPQGNLSYSGVLKDSSGNPIPAMQLTLWSSGATGQAPTSTTDSSGAFTFNNLIEGMYYLSADVWNSDSIYTPLSWQDSSIDLTSSQNNVQISLSSRTVGTGMISGNVGEYLDINGETSATPLAGKNVYVWQKNGGQSYSGVSDSNGDWSITGLTNGAEYYVSVNYDYQSYESPQQNNLVVARSSAGLQHQLLLKRVSTGTGSLTGRVKNAEDYSNLAGMQVSLYKSLGGLTIAPVTTDSRGEYSFTGLPVGEYFMVIADQSQSYKVAYMSVEIGTGANRINALLTEITTFNGSISGTVLDDRGIPLSNAYVEVWSSDDTNIGGRAQTSNQGVYTIEGLPSGQQLNFKVTPAWELRYEVSSHLSGFTLSNSNPTQVIDVSLEAAAFITGTVSGIPSSGNVPPVSVELIDSTLGTVVLVDGVDTRNSSYTFASVPAGSYKIRYTQRANYQGYSGGGWGFASGGSDGETISLKPVYWDGTTNGTASRAQAGIVTVAAGARAGGKSVTVTEGSSIAGTVLVETSDGTTRLTGTRSVLVSVYQKQSNGSYAEVGYPEGVNGYTNSEIRIAGLSSGSYKLKFEDLRKGNNSLSTVFNGGATSLAQAPEIIVLDAAVTTVSQTLSVAPPELSAAAFDLDDLGESLLGELENQIVVESELALGSEEPVYVGAEFAGEYVAAFANSTPTNLGGWKQVDSDGYISVVIPVDLEQGSHRIAVQDANLKVIGWSAVTIAGTASEAGVLTYSPRKAVVTSQDVAGATPKATVKKSQNSEAVSAEAALQDSAESTNNIWLMYVLGAALLLGIAGAIWLIRTRRS